MEQIMKEWPTKFLVPVDDEKLSVPDIIGSPLVTRFEHEGQTIAKKKKKKKKKEEVQNIKTDEEDAHQRKMDLSFPMEQEEMK
jgi:hypothetical protein